MATRLKEVEKVYMETDNEAKPMTVTGVVEVLKELRSSGDQEKHGKRRTNVGSKMLFKR